MTLRVAAWGRGVGVLAFLSFLWDWEAAVVAGAASASATSHNYQLALGSSNHGIKGKCEESRVIGC